MTGFVTLAVGAEWYYKLAANLLQSYRLNGNSNAPFAIFADRENEYTALFDKVVLMNSPHLSYLDKLDMLAEPPFDHNIFIDADCLIYNDVSLLIQCAQKDGVRCFGKALPITSTDGWFLREDIGEYKDCISFIPNMHGGIIFFSADALTQRIYQQAYIIAANYSKYRFKYFEKPADEPILALSVALNNCRPIELTGNLSGSIGGRAFCFYPVARIVEMNIRTKKLIYTMKGNEEDCSEAIVLHWQNHMTKKPIYNREVDRMTMGEGRVQIRQALRQAEYHIKLLYSRGTRWLGRHI